MAQATETASGRGKLMTDLDPRHRRRCFPGYGLKVYGEHVESAEDKRTRNPYDDEKAKEAWHVAKLLLAGYVSKRKVTPLCPACPSGQSLCTRGRGAVPRAVGDVQTRDILACDVQTCDVQARDVQRCAVEACDTQTRCWKQQQSLVKCECPLGMATLGKATWGNIGQHDAIRDGTQNGGG